MVRLKAIFKITVVTAALLYLVWFGFIWFRSMPVYYFTKSPHHHTHNLYQTNDTLGHKLKDHTNAYFIWSYGDSVPIVSDRRGFRVNGDQADTGGIMFFGDSFTLCEELPAAQAYPYLVAGRLCLPTQNTAASGYGYAQMVLQARRHIATVNPDAMVFQVSPWLAGRAINQYMPALFFQVPAPYYGQDGNIVLPASISPVMEITQSYSIDKFRKSEVSFGDKLSFVWNFTRKVFRYEYGQRLGNFFSPLPPTLQDSLRATQLAVNELATLADGKPVVLLILGFEQNQVDDMEQYWAGKLPDNVSIANADRVLWTQEGVVDRPSYERKYCFWHGDPPQLEDYHLNAVANKLIATVVDSALANVNRCNTATTLIP